MKSPWVPRGEELVNSTGPQNEGSLPLKAFRLTPPYKRLHSFSEIGQGAHLNVRTGTLVFLRVTSPTRDWTMIKHWVPRIRHLFPNTATILHVGSETGPAVRHLTGRATKLHVRAVLADGEPIYDTIRPILTEPVDLAGDVIEWLSVKGLQLPPRLRYLITQILCHATDEPNVSSLLRSIHEPETGTRRLFHLKGVPPPHCWFQVARALQAAIVIQSGSRRLLDISLSLGYHDHSALNQRISRTFRLKCGDIRNTLGWEWLMDRWVGLEMRR